MNHLNSKWFVTVYCLTYGNKPGVKKYLKSVLWKTSSNSPNRSYINSTNGANKIFRWQETNDYLYHFQNKPSNYFKLHDWMFLRFVARRCERLLRFNLKLSKPGETLKTQDINKVQWNMLFVVVRDFWDSWNTSYFGIQVFWKQFVVTEYFN